MCVRSAGFQTAPDLRAFCDYIDTEAGDTLAQHGDEPVDIRAFGQTLKAAAYPIGVYPDEISALAKDGESGRDVEIVKATLHHRKLVMSVDRLDYSKELVERFRAFERLIEHDATQRNNVSFLQIAPPTRSDVDAYRDIRLHWRWNRGASTGGMRSWTGRRSAIHRQYERSVLAALFREVHVGLVTLLRDVMNLVAKEYVSA